jgi:hypothetical protein
VFLIALQKCKDTTDCNGIAYIHTETEGPFYQLRKVSNHIDIDQVCSRDHTEWKTFVKEWACADLPEGSVVHSPSIGGVYVYLGGEMQHVSSCHMCGRNYCKSSIWSVSDDCVESFPSGPAFSCNEDSSNTSTDAPTEIVTDAPTTIATDGPSSTFQCAEEYGICFCKGSVVYGYGNTWTSPHFVDGSISCSNDVFEDVVPGQRKQCMCTPHVHNVHDSTTTTTIETTDSSEEMKYLGSGFCTSGYYAGWDSKGIESSEACNQVCLSEQQCTYAAFKAGKTCSRYNGDSCTLNSDANYITYAKQSRPNEEN